MLGRAAGAAGERVCKDMEARVRALQSLMAL
jgi:hypothetical protein